MPKTTAKAPKPSSSVPEASPRPVIEVRDFGPIANGVIEQRPLTVFAGPSNTGKSWMATLLYVLERHRQRLVVPGFPVGSKSSVLQTIENPSAWRTSIKNGEVLHLTPQETKAWCRIAKHVAEDVLPEQMQRSYGVGELASLTRECHGSKMSISFAVGSFAFRLDGMSRSTKAGPQRSKHAPFHVALPDNTEIPVSGRSRGSLLAILDVLMQAAKKVENRGNEPDVRLLVAQDDLNQMVLASLAGMEHSDVAGEVHYLPADRGGIMHSHSVVVSALIRDASRAGFHRQDPIPVLSGVLGDFLEKLVTGANGRRWRAPRISRRTDLSRLIESKILHGQVIRRNSDAGYPSFFYQPEGWGDRELPLMTSSSMVAELAPVVLFLRDLVHPGDTLILEEPEAHLHPAAQRQFVEEIVGWVKAGIKVVLTTHSEWILESVSNLVARAEGKGDPRKNVTSISKEDVGVWLFNPVDKKDSSKGSKIEEVPWTSDKGGYEAGFYKITVAMHNDWAHSINRVNNERAAAE